MAIRNIYSRIILGHGYLGKYAQNNNVDRKSKPFVCWRNVLNRCYNQKYIAKHPQSKGSTIAEEWLNYSNFLDWYNQNYYEVSQGQIMINTLLKSNSKHYCAKNCIFLPREINDVFAKYSIKQNDDSLPIDIFVRDYTSYGKTFPVWQVSVSDRYIGIYSDRAEAMQVWQETKQNQLDTLIKKYETEMPQNVIDILKNYKFEIKE